MLATFASIQRYAHDGKIAKHVEQLVKLLSESEDVDLNSEIIEVLLRVTNSISTVEYVFGSGYMAIVRKLDSFTFEQSRDIVTLLERVIDTFFAALFRGEISIDKVGEASKRATLVFLSLSKLFAGSESKLKFHLLKFFSHLFQSESLHSFMGKHSNEEFVTHVRSAVVEMTKSKQSSEVGYQLAYVTNSLIHARGMKFVFGTDTKFSLLRISLSAIYIRTTLSTLTSKNTPVDSEKRGCLGSQINANYNILISAANFFDENENQTLFGPDEVLKALQHLRSTCEEAIDFLREMYDAELLAKMEFEEEFTRLQIESNDDKKDEKGSLDTVLRIAAYPSLSYVCFYVLVEESTRGRVLGIMDVLLGTMKQASAFKPDDRQRYVRYSIVMALVPLLQTETGGIQIFLNHGGFEQLKEELQLFAPLTVEQPEPPAENVDDSDTDVEYTENDLNVQIFICEIMRVVIDDANSFKEEWLDIVRFFVNNDHRGDFSHHLGALACHILCKLDLAGKSQHLELIHSLLSRTSQLDKEYNMMRMLMTDLIQLRRADLLELEAFTSDER